MTSAVSTTPILTEHRAGAPVEVTEEFVLSKAEYFREVQLWPVYGELEPERWLRNFLPAELTYAVQLLNSFIYFNQPLVDEMFSACFQSLSRTVTFRSGGYEHAASLWQDFRNKVFLTIVSGEDPNPTDSGFTYARKARQVLELPQAQILQPFEILSLLKQGCDSPIVFVDDFVGSGQQFIETWTRPITLATGETTTFREVASSLPNRFYYCCLVCTALGLRRLRYHCPEVAVIPAHRLSPRYSALHRRSFIWPQSLSHDAKDVIAAASRRAGIPDHKWRGFWNLGLAIAFKDSVPDADLPLLYWDRNGWTPLIRRK